MTRETEIAARVISWLESQHWEVYQEVAYRGKVADIVGTSGYLTWIIECKKSLSLALLEQAWEWKRHNTGHYVSVALPAPRRYSKGSDIAKAFLVSQGIGMLEVHIHHIYTACGPALNRKASRKFRKSLNERQKTYAPAGNADGRYWTPFQETCRALKHLVGKNPGICLQDAIKGIRHHYHSDSTARACISQYLKTGKNIVPGVEARREGRFLRLYVKEQK